MSLPSNRSNAKKFSGFDNFSISSQLNVQQPASSKRKYVPTSQKCDRVRHSQSNNVRPEICGNDQPPSSPIRATTIIERVSPSSTTVNSASHSGTQRKPENQQTKLVYIVFLPHFLDTKFKPIKIPIVAKIGERIIESAKIKYPFEDYFDNQLNNFMITVDDLTFMAQLIAIGDDTKILRETISSHTAANLDWKNLGKVKKLCGEVTKFVNHPLMSAKDTPMQKMVSDNQIAHLIREKSSRSKEPDEELNADRLNKNVQPKRGKSTEDENPYNIATTRTEPTPIIPSKDLSTITEDLTQSELILKNLSREVEILDRKKNVLSELDTTGSILISLIQSLSLIENYLQEKIKVSNETCTSIPKDDLTYKLIDENKIFLEGKIELNLDSYLCAVKEAKTGQPSSFAYRIIRFCFPETYYLRVTLGRKHVEKKQIQALLKQESYLTDEKVKLPLLFIWGFENPFSSRCEGVFDLKLGQDRIRAFINHVFRKAGISKYSESAEKKVRKRIIAELCERNMAHSKNKVKQKESEPEIEMEIDHKEQDGEWGQRDSENDFSFDWCDTSSEDDKNYFSD